MASSEERLQILKMLEEKKITAQEASELLDAIEAGNEEIKVDKKTNAKWMRIKVLAEDGKVKANVNLPISLVNVGMKIGKKFEPKLGDADLSGINIEEILELVKQGAEGKIIDVYDEKSNTKVEISVE
jgi:DNA-binding transcriptional ArsR family regulator